MHRARNLNGRTEPVPSPNGNGHAPTAVKDADPDGTEPAEVGASTDGEPES